MRGWERRRPRVCMRKRTVSTVFSQSSRMKSPPLPAHLALLICQPFFRPALLLPRALYLLAPLHPSRWPSPLYRRPARLHRRQFDRHQCSLVHARSSLISWLLTFPPVRISPHQPLHPKRRAAERLLLRGGCMTRFARSWNPSMIVVPDRKRSPPTPVLLVRAHGSARGSEAMRVSSTDA